MDDLLHDCIQQLLDDGESVVATRGPNRELRGVVLELSNPRARLSRSANRGRLFSALGELSWYLAGSDGLDHIEYYIANYSQNVGELRGAYGPRMFGSGANAQIRRVIEQLRLNPSSRQAVVQLFTVEDLAKDRRDVPCTCSLQFFDRGGRIDLIVYMRSNDIFYGFPHDVFAFTMLQELVARSLGRELGTYTHMVGSMHLYDNHGAAARAFLNEGALAGLPMPSMPDGDPWAGVERLLECESMLRQDEAVDDLPSEADTYWSQLHDVLESWRAFKSKDSNRMRTVRDRLSGGFYDLYLSDKHIEMEAAGIDAE